MAARFLVATGNWNDTASWAATSGGAPGASFPVAGDTVALDTNSGAANITVNVASACTIIIASGSYTGTLTFDANLSTSGTVTFIAGMTIAGTTGRLICTGATATLTSAGKSLLCGLQFRGAVTFTLADAWVCTTLFLGDGSNSPVINGNTISCTGITTNITTTLVSGTTTFIMTGTGTLQMTGVTTGNLKNNLTFNTAGTITVSGTIKYSTGTITYTAGTIDTTGSTLTIGTTSPTTPTYNTSGMTWNNITLLGTLTYTITSDLNVGGTLSLGSTTSIITINGLFNINVANLTVSFTGVGNVTGTASIVMNGTGTWSGAGKVKNNLTFNSAGTITVSGTVSKEANTLTYIAGTMSMGTSILSLTAATTLATNGMTWYDLQITTTSTITLSNACQTTS